MSNCGNLPFVNGYIDLSWESMFMQHVPRNFSFEIKFILMKFWPFVPWTIFVVLL